MDEYPKCPVRDKTNTEESPFAFKIQVLKKANNLKTSAQENV